jgi:hypothetical protein
MRRNVAVGKQNPKNEPVDHRIDVGRGQAVSLGLPDGRVVWLAALEPGATSQSCCLVVTAREPVRVRGGRGARPTTRGAT